MKRNTFYISFSVFFLLGFIFLFPSRVFATDYPATIGVSFIYIPAYSRYGLKTTNIPPNVVSIRTYDVSNNQNYCNQPNNYPDKICGGQPYNMREPSGITSDSPDGDYYIAYTTDPPVDGLVSFSNQYITYFYKLGNQLYTTPQVFLNLPTDGSTLGDFTSWNVSYGGIYQNFAVSVHFSDNLSILTACADFPSGVNAGYSDCIYPSPHINADYSPNFSGGLGGGNSSNITKSIPLTIGKTYYAQAIVQDGDSFGAPLIYGDIISFTIGTGIEGGGVGLPPPITCDLGDIPCYLQQVIYNLFVPSSDSLNNFIGLYDTYKNKPPFGYIFAINDALRTLNYNGTEVYTLERLNVLDNSIFSPLRTALSWLMWFAFAFAFYKRIKDIAI
jgi:hypothetical protein